MEAGKVSLANKGEMKLDLVDAMVTAANPDESDEDVAAIEAAMKRVAAKKAAAKEAEQPSKGAGS